MYHFGHMGFFPGGCLFLLALVVLAAVAIIFFCKWKNGPCQCGRENNLEILKKRLALGEIGQDEYERLKGVLSSKS